MDSRLICTSTPVTLKVHGCRWTNLPTKVNHVSEIYALNRTLLAPVTGPFNDVLDRSLSAIKDTDIKDAQVNFLACRLVSYLLQILRVVAEPFTSGVLQLLLASPAAATFQHGILTQLACTENTVTLLRSLQYGSRFGLRPLFAYQDQPRERVLVQLYSGNVVFLGPPSLEEYQMHRVQRFNIQSRIYTYVNYTLQFSSEPMRPLSMSLPMTNVSTLRFDYVASTALYSELSSQQRSYFSVLEQVAQASRLRQRLRLFLQDEDIPSLNNSLTSANFNVITQGIGKFFSHSFLRLLLTVTDPFLQ